MVPHADIWSSIIKRHFPPSVRNIPITIYCNCQSFCTVTPLAVALCEVLLLCLSSPPSACVARHLSDVGLINYIGCIPQARTHILTHRWRETERRRGRQQDVLFILCRLWSYLFSEYVFHFIIPLWFLSISHFGLSSAASQKLPPKISLSDFAPKVAFACEGAGRGGRSAATYLVILKLKLKLLI